MNINELINKIEEISPLNIQEDWDNSGWQLKLTEGEVDKVLVALEITDAVIDEAQTIGAQLIITHHPLFFFPLKSIDINNVTGNLTKRLIKSDISVYSVHTCFDKADGGNNDYLGKLLGIEDISLIEGDESEIARRGYLKEPVGIQKFIDRAEEKLSLDRGYFRYSGDPDAAISSVFWCTGSGDEFAEFALEKGADLFITGDVKYHTAQNYKASGLNILDLGHYGTEYIFRDNMAELLRKRLPEDSDCEIVSSSCDINPFVLIR